MKVLGLMSGTSMDGLDCCYTDIEITKDYVFNYNIIDFKTYRFPERLRSLIYDSIGNIKPQISNICHDELGLFFADKSKSLLGKRHIDLISLHGQTISHIDKIKSTQIGNPKYLFDFFNVPVCYDFRTLDIALGGTGAPLIPFLDWLMFKNSLSNVITLNIGGIANITYLPINCKRSDVIGFDTGPGMCLIDQYIYLKFDLPFDNDGVIASQGKIDMELLSYLMQNTFINKSYPKSTSRENYGSTYLKKIINEFIKVDKFDFLRTLVMFSAKSICFNIKKNIKHISNTDLILSGGGANNSLLINDIKFLLIDFNVCTTDSYNVDLNIKEAFLMAVMGLARYKNINNNMPSVTGANKLASYGEIYE